MQEKAIPFALEGKDLLLRARTGSGKTAACLIPIIHQILRIKKEAKSEGECLTSQVSRFTLRS